MKLKKEYIQRIDRFLQRLGMEYDDLRLEMVDHIATEIEQTQTDIDAFFKKDGFNTPFLKYMIFKKESLENQYQKQVRKRFITDTFSIFKQIFQEIIQLKIWFGILVFYVIYYQLFYLKPKVIIIGFRLLFLLITGILFYKTWIFFKKIGKIKLWHSYYIIYIVTSYFLWMVPKFAHLIKSGYSLFYANSYFICFIIAFFTYRVFLKDLSLIHI